MRPFTSVVVAATLALSGLACGGIGAAQAAVLTGLDRATFQAAVGGGVTLQNFDGFANGALLTDDGFVTYQSNGGTPLVTSSFLTSSGANGLGATDLGFFAGNHTLTLTFDSAITAFAIDINTFAIDDGAYEVLLNTSDTAASIFETFPGTGTGQFIGFLSDTGFTSLTLSSNTGFTYTVDTLIYGQARDVTGIVPEPDAWALMILGLGAVGIGLRHGRRFPGVSAAA